MILLRVGIDAKDEFLGWGNMAAGSWHPHMSSLALLEAARARRFDVALAGVELAKCRVCVLKTVRGGTSYVPGDAAPDAADLATAHELVGSMTIGSLPDVVMDTGTVWVQVYLPPSEYSCRYRWGGVQTLTPRTSARTPPFIPCRTGMEPRYNGTAAGGA